MLLITVLLLLLVITASIWFWRSKSAGKTKNEIPTYVCPECGEHHCNCYLEKDVK